MKNILVLCTGNSARSIIGEALLNHRSAGRVRAYSAGSFPKGAVHPGAIAVLTRHGVDAGDAASKSWDMFTTADAPAIDIVITVCDNAAGVVCPIFQASGTAQPVKAHWGLVDPADAEGDDAITAAFERTFAEMAARVEAMRALDLEQMSPLDLQQALNSIGQLPGATRG